MFIRWVRPFLAAPNDQGGGAPSPDPTTDPSPADPTLAPQEGQQEPFDEARARAKITESNREAQALRARLKEAEAKVSEFEQQGKSEMERAIARAEQAERALAEAEAGRLRMQVAAEKGVPAQLAGRLTGSTLEEIQADADELLAAFPQQQPAAPAPSGRPVESRPASGDPTQSPVEMDPAKLADLVSRDGIY